jgi:HD-like signal output (HDOD) protein
MDIKTLLQQPNALPVAPKVVQDLISSFSNDDVSIDEIAKKLATDPVLSAKLLRLANSAYYHVSRSVNTVSDAVVMLGFATVRTLVISSGFVNAFKAAPGLDLKQFWRHSLETAVIAKWLASQAGVNTELAFTVGMTHSIGQLVIHAGMPEQAALLDKEVNPLHARRFDVERLALGYTYADVSAELAVSWHFPPDFSEAIRAFPKPLEHEPFVPMAGILHMASWFAKANAIDLNKQEMKATYPEVISTKLGLYPYVMLDKMPPVAELTSGLEELVS